MSYPAGLVTKQVSFGSAVVLEGGAPLAMRVTISATRSLVHRPSGSPLIKVSTQFSSTGAGSGVVDLPICDSPNMGIGDGTSIILDSAHPVTHTYSALINYYTDDTFRTVIPGSSRTVGPFALLSSSPSVSDVDDLLVGSPPPLAGEAVVTPAQYTSQGLQALGLPGNSAEQSALFGSLADQALLRGLDMIGAGDIARSSALNTSRYTDAYTYDEDWSDLTGWVNTAKFQVSAGRLYNFNPSTAEPVPLLAHPTVIGARARMKGTVTFPGSMSGPAESVGFGIVDTETGTPSAGSFWGFLLDTKDGTPLRWYGSNANAADQPGANRLTLAPGTTYTWEVVVDEEGTAISVHEADGFRPAFFYIPRTQHTPKRFVLWSSDSRGLDGASINPVSIRGDLVSARNSTVESAGVSVSWHTNANLNADGKVLALPAGYDSRVPVPLIIQHHGAGDNEMNVFTDGKNPYAFEALVASGFAVLSTNGAGNTWGATYGQAAILRDYRWALERVNISQVGLWGVSMGGLATLNTLMAREIPNIAGWLGTYPVCDLHDMYDRGTYAAAIRAAYGIAADGSDYDPKTFGHDPMLASPAAFRGVRMRFYASHDDLVVPGQIHSERLAARVASIAPEATVVQATGNHGDYSHVLENDYVAFFKRCFGKP